MSDRKTILLSGGKTTAPLAKHLIQYGYDVAVLDSGMANALFQKHGERVVSVMNLYEPRFAQLAQTEAANQFAEIFHSGIEGIAAGIEQLPEWQPFSNNGLRNDLARWFPAHLHQSIVNQSVRLLCLEKLTSTRKISLTIVHEDVTETYGGLAHWSKARGIPTMHVPHANHFAVPEISPDIHERSICDFIAATPHQEKWYRGNGYEGEVAMTGSPLFDRWDNYQKNREWAQKVLKLDPEKRTVVYLSSWGQLTNAHDDQHRFEEVLEAIALSGFDQLIVKLHPGESQNIEQEYIRFFSELGTKALITREYFEIALSAADMVIGLGPSNALIDTAIMGVPGVCVRMPGYSMNHPAMPEVEPDEVRIAVDEFDYDKWNANKEDFLFQMTGNQVGQASRNAALWAHRIIKQIGKTVPQTMAA